MHDVLSDRVEFRDEPCVLLVLVLAPALFVGCGFGQLGAGEGVEHRRIRPKCGKLHGERNSRAAFLLLDGGNEAVDIDR